MPVLPTHREVWPALGCCCCSAVPRQTARQLCNVYWHVCSTAKITQYLCPNSVLLHLLAG